MVHAYSFPYDDNDVEFMISLMFLFAYEGGDIVPGDDMSGSQAKWWDLDDFENSDERLIAPAESWIARRAVELYPIWKNQSVSLQP